MAENKQKLDRLRATRGGHRGYCTKLVNEVDELIEESTIDTSRCETIKELLDTKYKLLNTIDEEILNLCDIDDIEEEIEVSSETSSRIINARKKLQLFIATKPKNEADTIATTNATIPVTTNADLRCNKHS